MPRPRKCRIIECKPDATYFKPRGIPLVDLVEVSLSIDELESIRLADLEGLYHKDAAAKMQISRQTFGRILNGARRKTAECLLEGKALKIALPNEEELHEKPAFSWQR